MDPLVIADHPLPWAERLPTRAPDSVDLVVVHCTELPDLATAREYGERVLYASGSGNAGHYYIDRDGRIECYVVPERVSHHVRGYNERSVGIELVNRGRWPDWLDSRHQTMAEPYSDAQIQGLLALLAHLRDALPALRWIAGHEEIDRERVPASDHPDLSVFRKRDPGPLFPWPRVLNDCGFERLRRSRRTGIG